MATKTTGWKCTHSASIQSETNTSATIRVTCYWTNNGWTYDINNVSAWVYCGSESYKVKNAGSVDSTGVDKVSMGYHDFVVPKSTSEQSVSCYAKITSESSYVSGTKSSTATSVSVDAKPYHTITYNANNGTGAPSSQTKWYDESVTLSSTKPTRTGYTFVRWNTNTSNTGTAYNPGDTYSSNANLTLYAIWEANEYTITYDANGGSGAPSKQTKTYGVDLTLSSTVPTRTYYNFLGWSTSASGTVMYEAGSQYTNNSSATLYAVWELAYTRPRITDFVAQRCTSNGTIDDNGTYVKVTFDWATDEAVTEIKMEWKTEEGDTWSNTTITASGTSGSVNEIIGDGEISIETSYIIRAYVADASGYSHSPTRTVATPKYPIDVLHDGLGVAFGKAAELEDTAEFEFKAKFHNGVTGDLTMNDGNIIVDTGYIAMNDSNVYIDGETGYISLNSDNIYLDGTTGSITTADQIDIGNTFATTSEIGYKQNGVMILRYSGTNTILSASSGGNIYIRPNGTNSDDGRVLFKTDGTITAMGGTTRIYGAKVLYTSTNGSNAAITLNETVANFDYIEIFFKNNDGYYSSAKVDAPNGKTACIISVDPNSSSILYFKSTTLVINGTTITPNHWSEFGVKSSGITGFAATNYNYITKVVGYK